MSEPDTDSPATPGRLAGLLPDLSTLPGLSALPDALRDLVPEAVRELVGGVRDQADAVRVLVETGILRLERVPTLLETGRRFGSTTAATVAVLARHAPDDVGLVDEEGPLTWLELHEQSNALAHHLRDRGVEAGDGLGILCRNSRWFVLADLAGGKLGARVLYLNTGFGAPQLSAVLEREAAAAVIFDDEYTSIVEAADDGHGRLLLVGHVEDETATSGVVTVAGAVRDSQTTEVPAPREHARPVILTSGTTGTPKGAQRNAPPRDLVTAASLFSGIPYRAGSTMMVAAPMFHAWGLANLVIGTVTGSTVVVRRRFDSEATLAAIAEHHCDVLAAVPVMLHRIVDLSPEARSRHDTSSLRIVPSSGSALPAGLAERWMDAFGDNLYNLYGSTEVSMATVAGPTDLRAAPGTAGRPLLGVTVRLYGPGPDRAPIAEAGVDGEIFVDNRMTFDGYTGGGGKEVIDGFMSIGDVGHLDDEGRLFVVGRADDMVVSGGENVVPSEVEDLLHHCEGVADVAVVGIPDDEFGQVLRAVVVPTDPSAPPSVDHLRAIVKKTLAAYKVPRDWVFAETLPRNESGKVLRRQLAD